MFTIGSFLVCLKIVTDDDQLYVIIAMWLLWDKQISVSFRALVLICKDPLLYVRSDLDQGFRKGMQGPLEDIWKGYHFLIEGTQKEGLFCQKISGGSRPWDKGATRLKKKFFQPFGPQFGLKIRGSTTDNSIQKQKGLDLRVETPPRGEGSQIAFSLKQNHCVKTKSFWQ